MGREEPYMNKLETKKEISRLTLLFSLTYMISYITRINYGAIISEMEKSMEISRSLLSMAITGSFVTYGAGQIISGICGDRFSPKKLVSCGLAVTIIMNLLIPICRNAYQMLIIWCINGFAQAFMWPPLVRLMTSLLSSEDYKRTTANVSWGSSIGTIVIYLLSPILISAFGWKSVFIFSAAAALIMIFVWNKYSYDIPAEKKSADIQNEKGAGKMLFNPLMIGIMLVIILQGMLRDGITTWMPSYLSETYNISNLITILTGVVLPIFSIVCFQIATRIYRKKVKNPISCACIFFFAGMVSASVLLLFTGHNATVSVLSSAALTGCMHGVNLMLICMIPPFFEKSNNVSTVSGVLNSCTYIGSAISTYLIALLSEKLGWNFNLMIWFAITVLGTFISFLCIKPWKKKYMQ